MGYYYFPRKQKSQRSIEKNKAIQEYGKIISQIQLEKLSNKDLLLQKKLYEEELNTHVTSFSIENFEKKFHLLNIYVNKIKNIYDKLINECNRCKKLIKNKVSYYKEDAFWKPTCLVINQISIKENLKDIIMLEKTLFKILEDKDYIQLKEYFYSIQPIIKQHFLVYDLNLLKDNKIPGTYLTYLGEAKNLPFIVNISFQKIIEEILNKEPSGQGGYYLGLDYSFKKFKEIDKVPTYGNLEIESWKKSFDQFTKCSKNEQKHAEVILRFDEIDYKNMASKYFNFLNYYEKLKKDLYSVGIIIDLDFYKKYFYEAKDSIQKILRKIELIQRSRIKRLEKEKNIGYIYILKSEGYPGMYKVGSTYGLPEERAEDLSGTNVPDPWVVTGKYKFKNAEYYEKISHKLMANYRYRKDREFFKMDLKKIKQTLLYLSEKSENGNDKIKFSELKKKFISNF